MMATPVKPNASWDDLQALLDAANQTRSNGRRQHPPLASDADVQELLNSTSRSMQSSRNRRGDAKLQTALAHCRRVAAGIYAEALSELESKEKGLNATANMVRQTIADYRKQVPAAEQDIPKLDSVLNGLDAIAHRNREASAALHKQSKQNTAFHAVLYGRTGVGKSTLREILTNGDGASIGDGTPRTTRAATSYTWKDITVTDVPGVDAFQGDDDTWLAEHTASQADLVIFLLSDSNPQPGEAEALVEAMGQDHAVLGLINIKKALATPQQAKRFLFEQENLFAADKIHALTKQISEFISQASQGTHPPQFVTTHLLSRFRSDQPDFAEHAVQLRDASRFQEVEHAIINAVARNSAFAKKRTATAQTSGNDLADADDLLKTAYALESIAAQITETNREFDKAKAGLWQNAVRDAEQTANNATGHLKRRIDGFLNQHWENKAVAEAWQKEIDQWIATHGNPALRNHTARLQSNASQLVKTHAQQLEREINVTANALKIAISRTVLKPIAQPAITKENARRAAVGIGAGIALAGIAAAVLMPHIGIPAIVAGIATGGMGFTATIGAIASGIGGAISAIGGWIANLFKSKATRQRETTEKLRPQIIKAADSAAASLKTELNRQMDEIKRQMPAHIVNPQQIAAFTKTAQSCRAAAQDLIRHQMQSQLKLVTDCIQYQTGETANSAQIAEVARIPGHITVITTPNHNGRLPQRIADILTAELPETVITLRNDFSPGAIMSNLGLNVELDADRKTGAIKNYDLPGVRERRLAAQMLTEYHIV